MKRLVLELENDYHQKLKEKALKDQKSMRKILMELLEKWFKK